MCLWVVSYSLLFLYLSFDQTLLGGKPDAERTLAWDPRGLSSGFSFVTILSLTSWVLCLLISYLRGLDQIPLEVLTSSFLRGAFKFLQHMLL